ncbi:MAG TPA: hypothetical protein VI078_05045 [bacterium]
MMLPWKCVLATALAGSLALVVPSGRSVAGEPPGKAAAESAEHTVAAGDNLHLIAGYYYRDPRQWRRVWKLNGKAVTRPSHLVPGRTLRVERTAGVTWDIPYEEFRARVRGK